MNFRVFGIYSYAEPELRVTLTGPPLFHGVQLDPELAQILLDMPGVLKDLAPPDSGKKIFFGPGLDFCYPAFGIPVAPHLPLWWENVPSTPLDRYYPTGSEEIVPAFIYPVLPKGQARDLRVQHFFDAKFNVCILWLSLHGVPDMTYLPEDIRKELYENYRLTYRGHFAVFIRR